MKMRFARWVSLVALLVLGGCAARTAVTQEFSQQEQWLGEVPVAGEWSALALGLRGRIQISARQAMETSSIIGTVVIENTAKGPMTLSQSGLAPLGASAVAWRVGDV